MGCIDYKTMDYCFIAERMTDCQLGMFIDAIENYLAMNYGTSDYAVTHIHKKHRQSVQKFMITLEKMVEEMDDDAEQDY